LRLKSASKLEIQATYDGQNVKATEKKSSNSSLKIISPMTKENQFTLKYYLSSALAGGICCGITHGAVTPVDVVKTRIQLDPLKYNGK
jgi:Mitochondrial carrier protein